jgi:hypothetical protein
VDGTHLPTFTSAAPPPITPTSAPPSDRDRLGTARGKLAAATRTRVFQAHTEAQSNGPDQGMGYFGFGPAITSPDVGSILGMICNWAGPGAQHPWEGEVPDVTPLVQGQTMARDETSGLFVPVTNRIQYAPVNSCGTTPETVSTRRPRTQRELEPSSPRFPSRTAVRMATRRSAPGDHAARDLHA